VRIAAEASRSFFVPARPEAVAVYFSRNDSLLSRLVGAGRVQRLSEGLYRVSLRSFEALGLTVRPTLDVQFTDHPRETLMEALEVRAVEGPAGLSVDVSFKGSAAFRPHPLGTEVESYAYAVVDLGLPFPFSLLPERLLQAAATAVLTAAMESTAQRFDQLIVTDFTELHRPGFKAA
jgi:hypothetical protein